MVVVVVVVAADLAAVVVDDVAVDIDAAADVAVGIAVA